MADPDRAQQLRWLPVALLVAGIAVSGIRIVRLDDDPQRSTAFAMFARVDIAANRRVIVSTDTGVVEIPARLQDERRHLQVIPTDDEARAFGDLVLEAEPDLMLVRIQVVGVDADGRTMTRQVLADVVRSREGT